MFNLGIDLLINFEDKIGTSILAALRTFTFSLFEIILRTIVNLFNIFEALASETLIRSESIQLIYNKVGLILGLFMVFRITFAFIQYMIDPDSMTDQKKGFTNIIKKVIIVMILLGSTRALFRFAGELQVKLIHENILGKVILGTTENDITDAGSDMAYSILETFYRINEETKSNGDYNACEKIIMGSGNGDSILEKEFKEKNSLELAYTCLEQTQIVDVEGEEEQKQVFVIEFEWFIGIVASLLILYIICVYTIQVAVRSLQLAYLEMIAPVPIMMYITPKGEDKLKNWASQCLITYLDVFIRIAIMYFIIFACSEVSDSITSIQDKLNSMGDGSIGGWLYIRIIVIIAILIFAKKVPELFKEIFPSIGGKASLGFGLKMPKEAKSVFNTIGGAATGAAIGLVGGKGIGAVGGFLRGASGGIKGKKISEINARQAAINHRNRIRSAEGSTAVGRTFERINSGFGFLSGPEEIDRLIANEDKEIENIQNSPLFKKYEKNNKIISSANKINDEAKSNIYKVDNYDKFKDVQDLKEKVRQIEQAASNSGLHFDGKAFLSSNGKQVASFEINGEEISADDLNKLRSDLKKAEDSAIETWVNSDDGMKNSAVMFERAQIEAETGKTMTDYASIKDAKKTANAENAANAKAFVGEQEKIKAHEKKKKELQGEKKVAQANVDGIKKV